MRVKIDIDTSTFVRFGLVVLAFVLGLFAIYQVRTALIMIVVSFFLALALNPSVSWLVRNLPGKRKSRIGATATAYLIVISILIGVVILVFPPVIEQSTRFAKTVPALVDQAAEQRYVFEDFLAKYGLTEQVDQAIANMKDQATTFAANVGAGLIDGVGATLSGLLNLLFILVLTFLLLIEGPAWMKRIWALYDDPKLLEDHRTLAQRMYKIVTGFVNGQMVVAAIASTSTLVVILILSAFFPLPANLAIPLAAIIFVTGLVPLVGATIGAIVVSLVLALNSIPAAVIFIVFFIIYQQLENNLISPVVQAKTVELSALTVLVSVLIGVSLFGILGGLLSIPIAGSIRVLLNYRLEQKKAAHTRDSEGTLKKLATKLKSS